MRMQGCFRKPTSKYLKPKDYKQKPTMPPFPNASIVTRVIAVDPSKELKN
jgi:hypothetical protein